jgi:hypothetical protein
MADFINHMLVKFFYEYQAEKKSMRRYLLYFPAFCFRQNLGTPMGVCRACERYPSSVSRM